MLFETHAMTSLNDSTPEDVRPFSTGKIKDNIQMVDSAPEPNEISLKNLDYLHSEDEGDFEKNYAFNRFREHKTTFSPSHSLVVPSTWYDIVLSCGFGARRYTIDPAFADPQFCVRFAKKILIILLTQLTLYIALMSLVLSSHNFAQTFEDSKAFIVVACMVYILLYSAVRFSRCGGDGLCFMGYMLIIIIMTWCLVFVTTFLARLFPCWIVVASAIWLTLLVVIVGNSWKYTNILGHLLYGLAFFGGLVCGSTIGAVAILHLNTKSVDEARIQFILPVIFIPAFFSMYIVHEVKQLIGGRRTNLGKDQWMIAAIVL